VGIETAVAAFIGYTERADNTRGVWTAPADIALKPSTARRSESTTRRRRISTSRSTARPST
jgi:hypothetical protein